MCLFSSNIDVVVHFQLGGVIVLQSEHLKETGVKGSQSLRERTCAL